MHEKVKKMLLHKSGDLLRISSIYTRNCKWQVISFFKTGFQIESEGLLREF